MSEMDRLEQYLKEHNIPYQRFKEKNAWGQKCRGWNQIVSPNNEEWHWDVICHVGSYGYSQGLLEIGYRDKGEVEGWLTAEDVIERIKDNEQG